tara:strand:+ start:336 stop:908 length:573 start_codon:yes stop_codon:yes gene_type:complete
MDSFSYTINDTTFLKPWDRPNMQNIEKLLNFYSENFYPQKFNIYMIGKMNSNKPYDTWDVDLLITSYHNPSYKEIVSCMKFLTENAINQFSILVDTQYFENVDLVQFYYDLYSKVIDHNLENCAVYTYYHTIKKNGITLLQNEQHVGDGLYKIDEKNMNWTKVRNNIENGIVYYNPLLLFSPCEKPFNFV